MEAYEIVAVESVALERVNYDCGLLSALEVGEAEHHLFTSTFFTGNQAHCLEANEGPKDVRYFSFGRINRNTFHVDCVCRVFRYGQNV